MFERALDVDHRNITLWLRYAETEMRNKQINHARNLWDRAVTILPRANQFWYKYTYMEEMLGNVAGQCSSGRGEEGEALARFAIYIAKTITDGLGNSLQLLMDSDNIACK